MSIETLVKNLGRNITRKLVVKLEGNEIISIDDYDILYSYYDCWKCTVERLNAVFQGIVEADGQMENAIKHRINASDEANNAEDQTAASIYDSRFCIPLDFEILESSLPLYQYGLGTAHYLLGVWGWKYSIWGNYFFLKAIIWGNNFFSKHIYGTRTSLTETESCSGSS